jgi:hypothetical protein
MQFARQYCGPPGCCGAASESAASIAGRHFAGRVGFRFLDGGAPTNDQATCGSSAAGLALAAGGRAYSPRTLRHRPQSRAPTAPQAITDAAAIDNATNHSTRNRRQRSLRRRGDEQCGEFDESPDPLCRLRHNWGADFCGNRLLRRERVFIQALAGTMLRLIYWIWCSFYLQPRHSIKRWWGRSTAGPFH